MDKQSNSISRVATPLRAWVSRFAFLLLIGLTFGLMILDRFDFVVVERARTALLDAVAPALDVASRPIDSVSRGVTAVEELVFLRTENLRLQQDNERLLNWQAVARHLEAENARLREMLNLVPDRRLRYVSARVVGDSGGAFVRSVLINAGERHGARKGQAAVTGTGLAGRVAEVGNHSARVLLITDINSRVPVVVGDSRDRAVLGGDNSDLPRLMYLGPTAHVAPGDRVVTSGHAGVFPPGLPIGVVRAVEDKVVRVEPFADWDHLEFLRLIDFEMPGVLDLSGKRVETGAAR